MIAVDASFLLKLFLNEVDSQEVRSQWRTWERLGESIIGPSLLWIETASVLRRSVHRGIVPETAAEKAFEDLRKLEIEKRDPIVLLPLAWQLAKRFKRPTVYDSCYVALAVLAGCELWTTDRKLVNAVGRELPLLRTI